MTRPKFKDMDTLFLTTGFPEDADIKIEISPTNRTITYDGKRFFRLDSSYRILDGGKYAALYLWDGYGNELLRRKNEGNE